MKKNFPTSMELLREFQHGRPLTLRRSALLIILLSLPTIAAQLSNILLQYIDASMVGHLSTTASASIGLIAPVTWLFQGVCVGITVGFSVQMAQRFGSRDDRSARNIMKQGLIIGLLLSIILTIIIVALAFVLPGWLGGAPDVNAGATGYLSVFGLFISILLINTMGAAMVQSTGNMKIPSIATIVMCCADAIFNSFLIFPSTTYHIGGLDIFWPGADLGVTGASLGTGLADIVGALIYLWYMLYRNDSLKLRRSERLHFDRHMIKKAFSIGAPVALENIVWTSAQVVSTRIIAPLGTTAIASNAFAVTAESVCYQPGYGIGSAATTIVGQAVGAKNSAMAKRFAWISIALGMLVMSAGGVLLFVCAPQLISILSPSSEIQNIAGTALRIGAFAEPFYAASIVASASLRGAGDTLMSSTFTAGSIWCVRVPLALVLCPIMGINGYWLACVIQWFVCGSLFLWRVRGGVWLKRIGL